MAVPWLGETGLSAALWTRMLSIQHTLAESAPVDWFLFVFVHLVCIYLYLKNDIL
jgi:hypothetical protein